MADIKRLIPVIYLREGNAVKGVEDPAIVSTNPLKYAFSFLENDADELIVYSLSGNEEDIKKDYEIISSICEFCPIDVIGAVKNASLFYVDNLFAAGCIKVIINPKNIEGSVLGELISQHSKDKLVCYIENEGDYNERKAFIDVSFGSLFVVNPHIIKTLLFETDMDMIISLPDVSLDKIIELLKFKQIIGLSGRAIVDNVEELSGIKQFCRENDIDVNIFKPVFTWDELKLNSDKMIPVIVQDYESLQVLMCAYMNEEAYYKTIKSRIMTYYSRSRDELWIKGDTSGHYQYVKELWLDCDNDTILAKVRQIGAACHTGSYSCFFNRMDGKE